ncbi:MAG: GreA/GreB family elongation factor [Spirochaetes bacterium]|nr:GreA/GreB family elongation factor [Spirochaetota bacterium]
MAKEISLMSRAFVDENDGNLSEVDIPKPVIPLPGGVKNYVTPDGATKAKKELEELKITVRPKLSSEVSKDVTGGDSSDSEAVLAVRRKLRTVDHRIEYLTEMIGRMEVVDPKKQDSDRVLFGATVTVLENGKARRTFKIMGVDESDPKKGAISWLSPIARALLSHTIGDTVKIVLPRGETVFRIEKITYG